MMKHLIENREIIINSYLSPLVYTKEVKNGEIIAHKRRVSNISFYHTLDEGASFIRVEMDKTLINNIYNSIQNIESEIVQEPYDSMPF